MGRGLVSEHILYRTWCNMHYRCRNPRYHRYERYGGRGIKVCQRWSRRKGVGFWNFVDDMGERPEGMTLERRDNDGNYTPDNCYWATSREQILNRSITVNLTFEGRTQCGTDWDKEFGWRQGTVARRITQLGWSVERALTQPPKKRTIRR